MNYLERLIEVKDQPEKNKSLMADKAAQILIAWYSGLMAKAEIESFLRYGNLRQQEVDALITLGLINENGFS